MGGISGTDWTLFDHSPENYFPTTASTGKNFRDRVGLDGKKGEHLCHVVEGGQKRQKRRTFLGNIPDD